MRELPNCKIGVTSTVHSRLRDLKGSKDTFNDVIERLLDKSGNVSENSSPEFDVVEVLYASTKLKSKI